MTRYDRPSQIIDYCLMPLDPDRLSRDYQETVQRLEHVIRTLQLAAGSRHPVAVDFSRMPTLVINEVAHGDAA